MVYTLRFSSSKCSLFHNSNLFGSFLIHILYTGCAKIKQNNSGAKRLSTFSLLLIVRSFLILILLSLLANRHLSLTCFAVSYAIFRETIAFYAQELRTFLQCFNTAKCGR